MMSSEELEKEIFAAGQNAQDKHVVWICFIVEEDLNDSK